MEHPAGRRKPVPEYIQDVLARLAVVDDHGEIQARREVELVDEKLDLALAIAELVVVVESDLAQGDRRGEAWRPPRSSCANPFPGFWTSEGETPAAW